MGKNIKWGVIGLGKITRKFIHDLHLSRRGELYAVGSRSLDKALAFQKKWTVR